VFNWPKSTKSGSARQQVDIEGVRDGILILPGRRYRQVLQVSPVNFELKSEDEQDILIDTFESFLNSVGTGLQILIRTREIDLDKYLGGVGDRLSLEAEPVYRQQLASYDQFIRSLISTNRILTRNFYVVVPFDATAKLDFELVAEQLSLKTDIVTKGLARLGIQARELDGLETLDLFYSFYSPVQSKTQPLSLHTLKQWHQAFVGSGGASE